MTLISLDDGTSLAGLEKVIESEDGNGGGSIAIEDNNEGE